jgi:hypothetical protein
MTKCARNILGLFLLLGTMMLSDQIYEERLQAATSEPCSCAGYAYGHQYGGGFVGSDGSGIFYRGSYDTGLDCSLSCQNWIWGVGSSVCSTYNLRNGVGYVVLDWYWYFAQWSDHLTQPYDCDDL